MEKAILGVRVGGPAGRAQPGWPATLKMGPQIMKLLWKLVAMPVYGPVSEQKGSYRLD